MNQDNSNPLRRAQHFNKNNDRNKYSNKSKNNVNSKNNRGIHHGNFRGGDEDMIAKIFRTSTVLKEDGYRSLFMNNLAEGKYAIATLA